MNSEFTVSALADIRNLNIDEADVRAHVIRPRHVLGIVSSKGLEDIVGRPEFQFTFAFDALYRFHAAGFGNALHTVLKDQVAGYVMQLRQHGSTIYTREWQWAKTPLDGSKAWTPGIRMHVASCSKFITAIAMTKLLNDKHMSYDTPIVGFLPTYWGKGPNIDRITFRHLMTHRSGFNNGDKSDSDFAFMKDRVSNGVSSIGGYKYENMNFGLCRILISTILGTISPGVTFNIPFSSNDALWDYVTITSYVQYVRNSVFTPAGISGPTLDQPIPDALAYSSPVVGHGWDSGDLTAVSGGVGWHMSPDDLLAIMGTFRRRGTIMSPGQAQLMLDDGFGIDVQMPTPLGTFYSKSGFWSLEGKQVEQSLLYFLPLDMELVVLANSPIGSPAKFFPEIVTNAYMSNIYSGFSLRQFLQRSGLPISSSVHALIAPDRSVRRMLVG